MDRTASAWPPRTEFVRVGNDYVGYQRAGTSGPHLLYMPQWFNNIEAQWDVPPLARFVERLASFSQVVMFDKRGTGLSDPVSSGRGPFLEQYADDVLAVFDASGVERAS
jgi:pimeloyl-ACP methyl ester carboxylesterase